MTRQHATRSSIVRRLRLSPDRLAAAAALQDPNLLLQLRAAQPHGERPTNPPQSPTPQRRRRRALVPVRGALTGETGGALLLVAAVVVALLWSNSPWQARAVAGLAPLRRRDGAARVRRGNRLAATSPCPA